MVKGFFKRWQKECNICCNLNLKIYPLTVHYYCKTQLLDIKMYAPYRCCETNQSLGGVNMKNYCLSTSPGQEKIDLCFSNA